MADFSADSAARVSLSACLHLARRFNRLARQETWPLFAVLQRSVRKLEPFFEEVLDVMQGSRVLEKQLGALQACQAGLQQLTNAVSTRQGMSRVFRIMKAEAFMQDISRCCMFLQEAVESAIDADFEVPHDILADLESVAARLDGLDYDGAMRDISLMRDLHKQVKHLQTTWDTSGLHTSIMKTLNAAGVHLPNSSDEVIEELRKLKNDHQTVSNEGTNQDALLLGHIIGIYNIRKHEVCKEGPAVKDVRTSPTSVIDGLDEGARTPSHAYSLNLSSPKPSERGALRFSPEVLQQHEDRMGSSSPIPTHRRSGSNGSFHRARNPEELMEKPPSIGIRMRDKSMEDLQPTLRDRAQGRAKQLEVEISQLSQRFFQSDDDSHPSSPNSRARSPMSPRVLVNNASSLHINSDTDSIPFRRPIARSVSRCSQRSTPTRQRGAVDFQATAPEDYTGGLQKPGWRRQISTANSVASEASGPGAPLTVTNMAAGMMNPETYLACPLTSQVMDDPVLLVDSGHTFERTAIEAWIAQGNTVCPASGKPLRLKMLVPNLKVKEGVSDFGSATKAVLEAETHKLNPNMEKVVHWVEMMKSGLPVDQHIALSSLLHAELSEDAKAYLVAAEGIDALLHLLCYSDSVNMKGSTIRALWLHVLNDETGRLEVVRANGLLRISELIYSEELKSEGALECAIKCLKTLAFTGPLRAQARETGVLTTMVAYVARKGKPLPIRRACAAALAVLTEGDKVARAEVIKLGGVHALVDQLGHFESGGDRVLRLECLAALEQLSFDKNGQISIVSAGLVKDIAHIAHCQSSSLKLAVAKICRLLALNNYGNELAQVGLIPVMVQLINSGPGTESGEIGARVLCNMAQDPLCRKIIARAGVKLVRQSSNNGPEVVMTTCKKTANKIANSEHYPPHEWQVNLKSRYIQGDNADVLD